MCLHHPCLPLELEREIFLTLKDNPDVYRYMLVAKRVQVWLQPYISYKIVLPNEPRAEKFLEFLHLHPRPSDYKVTALFMGPSVNVRTAALILPRCQTLTTLIIRFSYRYIACAIRNPLYHVFLALKNLRCLYIGLTTLPISRMLYLPSIEVLNRLSHLHLLSSEAASFTVPLGFAFLTNLTHLSMSWAVGRSCTDHLLLFLNKSSCAVLIQWIDNNHSPAFVEENLRRWELVDRRIVVMSIHLKEHCREGKDMWSFAE
ncbi:hypothetical protein EV363DRAFT_1186878 [Boletus edulis]|nr:hypothetical protein EV363DRAFT_1186878 [Boletus edulis]